MSSVTELIQSIRKFISLDFSGRKRSRNTEDSDFDCGEPPVSKQRRFGKPFNRSPPGNFPINNDLINVRNKKMLPSLRKGNNEEISNNSGVGSSTNQLRGMQINSKDTLSLNNAIRSQIPLPPPLPPPPPTLQHQLLKKLPIVRNHPIYMIETEKHNKPIDLSDDDDENNDDEIIFVQENKNMDQIHDSVLNKYSPLSNNHFLQQQFDIEDKIQQHYQIEKQKKKHLLSNPAENLLPQPQIPIRSRFSRIPDLFPIYKSTIDVDDIYRNSNSSNSATSCLKNNKQLTKQSPWVVNGHNGSLTRSIASLEQFSRFTNGNCDSNGVGTVSGGNLITGKHNFNDRSGIFLPQNNFAYTKQNLFASSSVEDSNFNHHVNNLSLKKNSTNNKIQRSRPISSINSIIPKQHDLEEREAYKLLLNNILISKGDRANLAWGGTSKLQNTATTEPYEIVDITSNVSNISSLGARQKLSQQNQLHLFNQQQRLSSLLSSSASSSFGNESKPKIEDELLKSCKITDDDDVVAVTDDEDEPVIVVPINSARLKTESKPEFQDSYLLQIDNKYSSSKLNRKEDLLLAVEEAKEASIASKVNERIFTKRLRTDWLSPETIVIEEEEVEEINDFPEFTEEQQRKIDFAMRGGHVNQQLIQKFNITIARRDLLTLSWNPLEWLNDEVINFYMNLLMERSEQKNAEQGIPKVYAMNTFFIPRLLKDGHTAVRRWTRKVDIFAYDVIMVPVHVGGVHWCMAIIHIRNKTIRYYDSMGAANQLVLNELEKYLKAEMLDKKQQQMDMDGWTSKSVSDCPRQKNSSDCGVFSCMFAEFTSRNRPFSFTQAHMTYFRQRMVLEISTGQMML